MCEIGQEVAVSSFFLSLKDSKAWPRGLVAFFFSWRLAGARDVVLATWQVLLLGSDVSLSV